MAEEKREVRVRITNQFRSGNAMVYDLSCEDTRLTVQIAPAQGDEGTPGFTAVAHARQSPDRPTINESGATRGDALRALGRSWAAKNGEYGFPTLDWELVAQALTAVRAI
jgi:hypothetical protein